MCRSVGCESLAIAVTSLGTVNIGYSVAHSIISLDQHYGSFLKGWTTIGCAVSLGAAIGAFFCRLFLKCVRRRTLASLNSFACAVAWLLWLIPSDSELHVGLLGLFFGVCVGCSSCALLTYMVDVCAGPHESSCGPFYQLGIAVGFVIYFCLALLSVAVRYEILVCVGAFFPLVHGCLVWIGAEAPQPAIGATASDDRLFPCFLLIVGCQQFGGYIHVIELFELTKDSKIPWLIIGSVVWTIFAIVRCRFRRGWSSHPCIWSAIAIALPLAYVPVSITGWIGQVAVILLHFACYGLFVGPLPLDFLAQHGRNPSTFSRAMCYHWMTVCVREEIHQFVAMSESELWPAPLAEAIYCLPGLGGLFTLAFAFWAIQICCEGIAQARVNQLQLNAPPLYTAPGLQQMATPLLSPQEAEFRHFQGQS